MLAHPAVMMRTELARKIGGYRSLCNNERVDLAEDFDLWLRLSKVGEIHNLAEPILYYRQHSSQISSLHTSSQGFATQYISFVHMAEMLDRDFKFKRLLLKPFEFNFLYQSVSTLSRYIPLRDRLVLVLEGSAIYLNLESSFYTRVIAKITRRIRRLSI
jgi:hypothetical protein